MRSIGAVLERLTNRIEPAGGWSNTTYNRTNPFFSKPSGTKETQAFRNVSTLWAVVTKISNSTASVNWCLYRKHEDGRQVYGEKAKDNTKIQRHVALDLWNKPNKFYTGSLFRETGQQYSELKGEQFWVIARNPMSPMPLELWQVHPMRMHEVADPDEFLLGWIYKGPNDETIPLNLDQVIHSWIPDPDNPHRGLGPVQSLLTDLGATVAAGQYNANFFKNDASPGGVIEMDTRLSDSEWTEFNERWRHAHQGVSNAHRVAMIENGGKWKDVAFSMRDMQFTELRNISREMIREAFALHPHMLGLTEDINRANAEAAEDVFARWVLKPRLDRIKDALNFQLLPLFGTSGEGLEFDFDDPSLEDSEATNNALVAKSNAAKVLIDAGGEFASVLEAVGLPEIEFDQAKVDREVQAKKDQVAALQAGQQSGNGEKPPAREQDDAKARAIAVGNGWRVSPGWAGESE